ncbi:hypothetical protein GQ55_6G200700 [Panicum hallii var. hallii]|uniref:Uncharacterized protein n=1 Tax=Panicum hallii var. hallii TaxID=1504633 RepID=A0A2T7D7M8_9POAL|nr:hypothetical protein GQ55_6G200700 [Panicum hallii var. hallii]
MPAQRGSLRLRQPVPVSGTQREASELRILVSERGGCLQIQLRLWRAERRR